MRDGTLNLHGDGSATLSPDRLSACLSAAWELEALAQVLSGLHDDLEPVEALQLTVIGAPRREAK